MRGICFVISLPPHILDVTELETTITNIYVQHKKEVVTRKVKGKGAT